MEADKAKLAAAAEPLLERIVGADPKKRGRGHRVRRAARPAA
jgi:hypothetical protein